MRTLYLFIITCFTPIALINAAEQKLPDDNYAAYPQKTREDVLANKIYRLKEVQQLAAEFEALNKKGGKVRLSILDQSNPTQAEPYYSRLVGNNGNALHFETRLILRINSNFLKYNNFIDAVTVFDPVEGIYLPLKNWRKQKHSAKI